MNDETIGAIKKYWPWALAIVAGGYLLFYRSSSSASADTVSTASQIAAPDYTALAQINASTQNAQIAANTAETLAMYQTIGQLGGQLQGMNQDFIAEQIATYDAAKSVNIAAIQGATAISSIGLTSAAEIQSSFNSGVSQMSSAALAMRPTQAGGNAAANAGKVASIVGAFFSDRRLKRNVCFDGVDDATGLRLYVFSYKASPGKKWRGVMADEVLLIRPDAVSVAENGFMMVDYSKLGIKFEEVSA